MSGLGGILTVGLLAWPAPLAALSRLLQLAGREAQRGLAPAFVLALGLAFFASWRGSGQRLRGEARDWWWLVPVALLLIAFAVRLVRLQARPLWYDEAFAVLYASLSPARMVYGTVTPAAGAGAADVHPLLYYFLLHGWMALAGRSPFAVRFLSVILGMVTVALLERLAAWCFDRKVGLAVVTLAAVNPFHVAYSQEARMYALLGLAAVMAAWGLLRALTGAGWRLRNDGTDRNRSHCQPAVGHLLAGNWTWWAFYAVSAALTLYAHNLGAFVLLALHLLVVSRRRWWRCLPALSLADLIALALFGPWLVEVLPGQLSFVGKGYWLTAPGAEEIVRAILFPTFTFYEPAPLWLLALGLLTGTLILALLGLRAWRARSRVSGFLLLCWAPVLSLFLVSQWRPVYLDRALLPSALFYLVAVGWLLARGKLPHSLNLGLVLLLAATTVSSLAVHYTYAGFPRPPFQQAVAYLRDRVRPGDAVVHTSKLTYFPMRVYAPDLPGVFLADASGSPQDTLARPTQEALGIFATSTITDAVGKAGCIWLIYFPREAAEMEALGAEHPVLAWLEGSFAPVAQERIVDLVVAEYQREER